MSPTDEDVLSAAMVAYQAGDESGFERLYLGLAPALRRYLLALCLDPVWADELLQDSFLLLHRVRGTYEPERPVRPWAFGIARNVFLQHRRRRRRRQQREVELPAELDVELPESGVGPGDRDLLRRALGRLDPGEREILLLHHAWGFSFAEIAGALGLRAGTAKVRAHRALQSLRRWVGTG